MIYDPFDPQSLQGWHLNAQRQYEPILPNSQGWLWCETLGLWFGLWEGQIRREPATDICTWLRFYDSEGNLILLQEEMAEQERQRAEQQRQRAERLARRLRELGEDPDQL
jgi:hypothetical protein